MLKKRLHEINSAVPVFKKIDRNEVLELIEKAKEYMLSENDELIRSVINLFIEKINVGENGVEIIYYLHPFSYISHELWKTYVTRQELISYKGFSPKIMKGRWSRKAIISLSESQHLDQQISGADEGTRLRHGRLSATCITGCVYKRRTTIGMLYGMLSTSVRPYPRLNRAIGREGRHTNKRLDRSRGSLLKWGSLYGDLGFAIILNIGKLFKVNSYCF